MTVSTAAAADVGPGGDSAPHRERGSGTQSTGGESSPGTPSLIAPLPTGWQAPHAGFAAAALSTQGAKSWEAGPPEGTVEGSASGGRTVSTAATSDSSPETARANSNSAALAPEKSALARASWACAASMLTAPTMPDSRRATVTSAPPCLWASAAERKDRSATRARLNKPRTRRSLPPSSPDPRTSPSAGACAPAARGQLAAGACRPASLSRARSTSASESEAPQPLRAATTRARKLLGVLCPGDQAGLPAAVPGEHALERADATTYRRLRGMVIALRERNRLLRACGEARPGGQSAQAVAKGPAKSSPGPRRGPRPLGRSARRGATIHARPRAIPAFQLGLGGRSCAALAAAAAPSNGAPPGGVPQTHRDAPPPAGSAWHPGRGRRRLARLREMASVFGATRVRPPRRWRERQRLRAKLSMRGSPGCVPQPPLAWRRPQPANQPAACTVPGRRGAGSLRDAGCRNRALPARSGTGQTCEAALRRDSPPRGREDGPSGQPGRVQGAVSGVSGWRGVAAPAWASVPCREGRLGTRSFEQR